MNVRRGAIALLAMLVFWASAVRAQGQDPFDLQAYRAFLSTHQDLTHEGLSALHPAGSFQRSVPDQAADPAYFGPVDSCYQLTAYEKELLRKHGFVVSERLKHVSFGHAFLDIYHADLPVFVSADAILHAFHMSYDALLQGAEKGVLIGKLDSLLARLHDALPGLVRRFGSAPGMLPSLQDVDLYLTIPRRLLGGTVSPYFAENIDLVNSLEANIAAAQPAAVPLFGSYSRTVDFSQFVPRGHYADEEVMRKYFKAMIWLGRTEFYCGAPRSAGAAPPQADLQRQTMGAVLLVEAANSSSSWTLLDEMDEILRGFVGEQDNITPAHLRDYITTFGLGGASELTDTTRWQAFTEGLLQNSFAVQRINSQILWSDPSSPDQIQPAASFLLLGQRFILDSYVTGNVVYDRILYKGGKVLRMLPSTLDVLFALGNDAAGQLLAPEMARYPYATNLAALQYLIDGYEPAYWQSTMYTAWLHALKALSPPAQRTDLPPLMQSAAWWQKGMNTQLASWAQLRHDNLLYAKQSYTGSVVCSFPESFVEPVPEFFLRMRALADAGAALFTMKSLAAVPQAATFFAEMGLTMDTLAVIAGKQRTGGMLSDAERSFLHRMIYEVLVGCAPETRGWYPRLFYTGISGFGKLDIVVADVHTAPTDESGGVVGWVLHAGTGPVTLAVVLAPGVDGTPTAFVGPVMSYYEYVSTNFKRLTDEEWRTQYVQGPAFRPPWVNLYLADATGNSRGSGPALLTGVSDRSVVEDQPREYVLAQNYPNPFNSSTIVPFSIATADASTPIEVSVFDVEGRLVRQLFTGAIPPGAYTVRWDGANDAGTPAASGMFFCRLRVGEYTTTRSMVLLR